MPFYCPSGALRGFDGFAGGFAGLGDNAPVGQAATDYYTHGTKFLWLAPAADFGFAFALDPGASARAALAQSLASKGYSVSTIYGERGGPLEVSGSQNIDRNRATDIRDQITGEAQAAGFFFTQPILFNVEAPGVPFKVGSPGSKTVWGDQTPVAAKSIFSELGVDLSGDNSFLGGSLKNVAIYAGIGLLVFALISSRSK